MYQFGDYGFNIIWPLLAAALILALRLARTHRWTLPTAGMVIGMALTCLIGFGICANAFNHI